MAAHENLSPHQFGLKYGSQFSPVDADWQRSDLGYGRTREGEARMFNTPEQASEQAMVHTGGVSAVSDRKADTMTELHTFVPAGHAVRGRPRYN